MVLILIKCWHMFEYISEFLLQNFKDKILILSNLSKVHSYLPSACPQWNVIKIDVWWSISLRQSFLQPYESSKRDCAESYYLLIVFGSGVLLLFIQSSQPRLSPRVRAGSAHRFVCCTLPAGVISEGNTVLLYSGCCWCFVFFRK